MRSDIDITMGGVTTTHDILLMPQETIDLSADYAVTEDFNGSIDYDVKAKFVAGNSNALRIPGKGRKGAKMQAPRRVISQSGTQVNVRQLDIALKLLSKKTSADGETTIVAEVNNASLLPIADDVTIKVGLYNSPVVYANTSSFAEVTLNASDLYDAAEKQNKVKLVTLTTTQPDFDQMLYVCSTPVQDGESVKDVRPANNVLPVSLLGKYILGDVNGDGKVDTQDAIKVIQHYLGKKPSNFIQKAADMTKEGSIDTQDAIQIIKKFLNK